MPEKSNSISNPHKLLLGSSHVQEKRLQATTEAHMHICILILYHNYTHFKKFFFHFFSFFFLLGLWLICWSLHYWRPIFSCFCGACFPGSLVAHAGPNVSVPANACPSSQTLATQSTASVMTDTRWHQSWKVMPYWLIV